MQNRIISFQTTNIFGAKIQYYDLEIKLLHPAFLLFTSSCILVFASCTIKVDS